MGRPIRRGESAQPADLHEVRAAPARSPLSQLAAQLLDTFGEQVRAAPTRLPSTVTPLLEPLLSPTETQIAAVASRLLGAPRETKPDIPESHQRVPALHDTLVRAISAGITKAETSTGGFQFLRVLLMVLTLGLVRLQQKKPFSMWVESRLREGPRVPSPLTPAFCAELISLKQLHRGLLEQAAGSPAAAAAASRLGTFLDQIGSSLQQVRSHADAASERTLAGALLDELSSSESQRLEDLLVSIAQAQLATWSAELPDRISSALTASSDPSEALQLAQDLERLQQLERSPRGEALSKTLANAAPLGLQGDIRTSLQGAWRLPSSQILARLAAYAGLLKAYDPFFQQSQASPRGGVAELRPSAWLSASRPPEPEWAENLNRAVQTEAIALADLILESTPPLSLNQAASCRRRLEQLAALAEAVPSLGPDLRDSLCTAIAGRLTLVSSPDQLGPPLQAIKAVLDDLPPTSLHSLQLEHLVRDAWNAAELKSPLEREMARRLIATDEQDLADLLQTFDQSLAVVGTLVGQRTLRGWAAQALAKAALERPELRARAAHQLMDGALEQLNLAMQPRLSSAERLSALKEQLSALHAVGADKRRLAEDLLASAAEEVSQSLQTAVSQEDLIQRAEQAASWAQQVQDALPSFEPLTLLTEAAAAVLPSAQLQLALARTLSDATHALLRDPIVGLEAQDVATLGLMKLAGPGAALAQSLDRSAPGEMAQSLLDCPVDTLEGRWKTLSQIERALEAASGRADDGHLRAQGLEIALELQLESVMEGLSGSTARSKNLTQEFSRAASLWRLASKELPSERAERCARSLDEMAGSWARSLAPPKSLTDGMLRSTVPWNPQLGWRELLRKGGEAQLQTLIDTLDPAPESDVVRSLCQAARKIGKGFEVPPPPSASALQGLLALEQAVAQPAVRASYVDLVSAGGLEWTQLRQQLQRAIQKACKPESAVLWEAGIPTGIDILQRALDTHLLEPSSVPAALHAFVVAHPREALFDALRGIAGPVADLMRVMASQLVLAQPGPAGVPEAQLPLEAAELDRITQGVNWVGLAKTFPRQFKSLSLQLLNQVQDPAELAAALSALKESYGTALPEPIPGLVGQALARTLEQARTSSDRARLNELRVEFGYLLALLPDAPASVIAYLSPREDLSAALEATLPPEALGSVLHALNLRIAEARPGDETMRLAAQQYNLFKDPLSGVKPSRDLVFPGGLLTPLGESILDHALAAGSSLELFVPPLFGGRGLTSAETSAVADFLAAAQQRTLELLTAQEIPDRELAQRLALISPEFLFRWLQDNPEEKFPAKVGQAITQLLLQHMEVQLAKLPPVEPSTRAATKATSRGARTILEEAQRTALARIGPREASRLASERAALETLLEQPQWQKNLLSLLGEWSKASQAVLRKKTPETSDLRPLLEVGRRLEAVLRPFFDTGVHYFGEHKPTQRLFKQQSALNESTHLLLGKLISLPDSPEKEALLHLAPQIRTYLSAYLSSEA